MSNHPITDDLTGNALPMISDTSAQASDYWELNVRARVFESALRLVTKTPHFYDMPEAVQEAVNHALGKEKP